MHETLISSENQPYLPMYDWIMAL